MTTAKPEPVPDDALSEPLQLNRFLTYRLSRVQSKLNAQATRILHEASAVTLSQWRIIALIGSAGQTRMSKIAKETALDKGLLSRNLKKLIEDGLVITEVDEVDNRIHNLRLSPRGQDIFERTLPIARARQEKLTENLTEDDLAAFYRVLDTLEAALES